MNHSRKMCRWSNIIVVPSDEEVVDCTSNNNDQRWSTLDETGFTEVPGDDNKVKHGTKSPVDLDKVIIKKRATELKPHF